MTKVHRVAGLRISRVQSTIGMAAPSMNQNNHSSHWRPSEGLPDLAPPEPTEERLRMSKRQIFSSDLLSVTHGTSHEDVFSDAGPATAPDRASRVAIYALNGVVAALSLPVGLALLAFNVLGGESIRTTAHVIALTGFGMALAQTDSGFWLLTVF